MKLIVLVCGLSLVGKLVSAQVGDWQIQINSSNGAKETGFGYLTVNQDGTVDGYSLSTLSFGVVTYTGTWVANKSTISVSFTESLNGQVASGTAQGKFSSKSFSTKILGDNGATATIKGKPSVGVPNPSGTFSGSVKQSGLKVSIPETFDVSEDPDFPGVFDFSGTVNGALNASGQVILEPNGTVIGYAITDQSGGSTDASSFIGKYNSKSHILTTTGIDQNGVKATGKFQAQ